MAGASGRKLDETYKLAWIKGLKTTYYLRAVGATHTEKSTSRTGALNAVNSDGGASGGAPAGGSDYAAASAGNDPDGAVCTMRPSDPDFDECEACQ